MLGKKPSSGSIENSAMIASEANMSQAIPWKTEDKPRVWCDYCNKPRHTHQLLEEQTRQYKYSISLYTWSWSSSFQQGVDHLLKLLKSNSGSFGITNASLAQSGSESNALSCRLHSNCALWIIDSGASDHMTSFAHLFHTYIPCSGLEKIRIADGSF